MSFIEVTKNEILIKSLTEAEQGTLSIKLSLMNVLWDSLCAFNIK